METFLENYKLLLSVGGAIITFIYGLWQYLKAERLKYIDNLLRVRDEIEAFVDAAYTKEIFTLTDYISYTFDNFKTLQNTYKDLYLDDDIVCYALRAHTKTEKFTDFEVELRELYDRYFTQLEKYYYFIRIGLFDKEFLQPYIGYYIRIMGNKRPGEMRKEERHIQALHNYMSTYYPVNLVKLFKLYGYVIHARPMEYKMPEKYLEFNEKLGAKRLKTNGE